MAVDWSYYCPKMNRDYSDDSLLINTLNTLEDSINIATIPFHQAGGWRILAESNHNWMFDVGFLKSADDHALFEQYLYKYPYLDIRRMPSIARDFAIDLFIVCERFYRAEARKNVIILPNDMRVLSFRGNILIGKPTILSRVEHALAKKCPEVGNKR